MSSASFRSLLDSIFETLDSDSLYCRTCGEFGLGFPPMLASYSVCGRWKESIMIQKLRLVQPFGDSSPRWSCHPAFSNTSSYTTRHNDTMRPACCVRNVRPPAAQPCQCSAGGIWCEWVFGTALSQSDTWSEKSQWCHTVYQHSRNASCPIKERKKKGSFGPGYCMIVGETARGVSTEAELSIAADGYNFST